MHTLRKILCLSLLLLAVPAGAREIRSPSALNNPTFTIGTVTGSASEPKADIILANAGKKRFATVGDALLALKHGSVDAVVYNGTILNNAAAENPGTLRILDEALDYSDMCMALSPKTKYATLHDELEEFIQARAANGELKKLYRLWNDDINREMPSAPEFENPAGTLQVGTQGTMPPLSFYRGKQLVGANIELIFNFAKEYNYNVEFRVENLTAQLNDAEFGKIDMLDGTMYYSEERAEKVDFIMTPLQRAPVSVMVLAEAAPKANFWGKILASAEKTFLREERWRMLLSGLEITLFLAAGTLVLGTLLGFAFCLVKRSGPWPFRAVMNSFIALIGGTPIVLTLMICFYIVFSGTGLGEIAVAIIAFSIDFGCHVALTLDSGLNAVPAGEVEAADAMGFSKFQTFREIQFPQALGKIFSLYKAQVVAMIKSTSIVGYISVQDLTKVSDIIRSRTYEAFFSLVTTALIYFLIARSCLALLGRAGDSLTGRHIIKGVERME